MKKLIYECCINPFHQDHLTVGKDEIEQKRPVDYVAKGFKNTGTGKRRNKMRNLQSKKKKRQ